MFRDYQELLYVWLIVKKRHTPAEADLVVYGV